MPASIFNGSSVKVLKDILKFKTGSLIISGDSDDPSVVAKDAPQSSLYTQAGTNKLFIKEDSGSSTNWRELDNSEIKSLTSSGLSTGLIDGGALTANVDTTKFDVTAGSGVVVDSHTDPVNPSITFVSWSAQIAVTATRLATHDTSGIGFNSSGTIIQIDPPALATDYAARRDNVMLGTLLHFNNTEIEFIVDSADTTLINNSASLSDFSDAIGGINADGNLYGPATGLEITKTAGKVFAVGANYKNNKKNPNFVSSTSLAPGATFTYLYRDGSGGWISEEETEIISNLYDDGSGVLQNVLNSRHSNQRIFLGVNGQTYILYAQEIYLNQASALDGFRVESFEFPKEIEFALFRSIVTVKGNASDLNDTDEAVFTDTGKFGEVGLTGSTQAVTDLQTAYNNSSDGSITVTSTNNSVKIQDNSTPIADNLIQVTDNAGTTEYFAVDSTSSKMIRLDIDNITIDGNDISTTDTDGNLTLSPDGNGEIVANKSLILSGDATQNLEAVTKQQLDALSSTIENFEWQSSVIDKDLTTPPGSPSTGDRYLIGLDTAASSATGAWAGHDGEIAEYDGAAWAFVTNSVGMFVAADDEDDKLYNFGGSVWAPKNFESTTASGFLNKVGFDIQLTNLNNNNVIIGSSGNVAISTDTSSVGDVQADSAGGLVVKAGLDAIKIGNGDVDNTELSTLDGVTSNIQTQLDDKANKTLSNLTSPTAINQDLEFDAERSLKSSNKTSSETDAIFVKSGDVASGSGNFSGNANVVSGDISSGDGTTGDVNVGSGHIHAAATGNAGNVNITSGTSDSSAQGGSVYISASSNDGTGDGGDVAIDAGSSSGGGNGGSVSIVADADKVTLGNQPTGAVDEAVATTKYVSDNSANTALSNLTSPTAVNQSIVPGVDGSLNLGSPSLRYGTGSINTLNSQEVNVTNGGGLIKGSVSIDKSLPSGSIANASVSSSIDGESVGVSTGNDATADANPSGSVLLESGNKTAGTGDSGDVVVQTGTSVGGSRGSIKVKDGSEGTVGQVLKSKDADGSVEWGDLPSSNGINYVPNPDMEINLAGYNLYNDGSVAEPVDGTGGISSGNLTMTEDIVTPLRGTRSLRLTKGLANAQGEGVSIDLDKVDSADANSALYVSFDFRTSSSFETGDIVPYIYNIDTSALEPMSRSGDSSRFTGRINTDSTSNDFRLILHVASTSTSIYFFDIDNIKVGPDKIIDAPIMAYMGEYTPTVTTTTGAPTNYTTTGAYWRRDDIAIIEGDLTFSGAVGTWGDVYFSLPSGLTVDDTKLVALRAGDSQILDTGANQYVGKASYVGGALQITVNAGVATYTTESTLSQAVPHAFASGDIIAFRIELPIEEWANSSAVLSTTEMMNETVKARYTAASTAAVPNGGTVFDFSTKEYDTHNAVSGSGTGWKFTVPKTGYYNIKAGLVIDGNGVNRFDSRIYVDGVPAGKGSFIAIQATSTATSSIEQTLYLQKDQYVAVAHAETGPGASTYSSGGQYVEIIEQPDFSVYSVYGETNQVEASDGVATAWSITVNQWGDLSSIELTPGEWDISASASLYVNSSVAARTQFDIGISSTSGNSAAGMNRGKEYTTVENSGLFPVTSVSISPITVTVTENTTYYIKGRCDLLTNSQYLGYYITARKIK